MKKTRKLTRMIRWIASLMTCVMIITAASPLTALAEEQTAYGEQNVAPEKKDNTSENVNTEEPADVEDKSNENASQDNVPQERQDVVPEEEQEQGMDNAGSQQEPAEEQNVRLNYFYISKSYVQTPEEQDILVSWGDGSEEIADMQILFEKSDGGDMILSGDSKQNGLYLFTRTFEASENGIYEFKELHFTEDGNQKVFKASELGVSAFFGVDEEYQGNEKSEHLEIESVDSNLEEVDDTGVSTSVVTIDENADTTVSGSVSDALNAIGAQADSQNSKARSSEKASDLVVVLDPGHDSKHAGARGNGVAEEVAALKIAQYCKAELEKYSGVKVYMTRENASCPFPNATNNIDDIVKRVEWAKSVGASVFVSFHLNSSTATTANGAEVYYPAGNSAGKNLADKIMAELASIGLNNRGSKPDSGYAVITSSVKNGFPGLIIEHAFVTNSSDAANYLKTEAGLKKLGAADAQGIIKSYGLTKGGWVQEGGNWKYELNGKFLVNQWADIGSYTYYFDKNGYRVTGWMDMGGYTYYFNGSGIMLKGFNSLGGYTYYFNGTGKMLKGFNSLGGYTYYFNSTGKMLIGFNSLGGHTYYFNSTGKMLIGFNSLQGYIYYFDTDGKMLTGKQMIGGKEYHFDDDGKLLEDKNGFVVEGNYTYYYKNGVKQTGFQDIDGYTYYFNGSGIMLKGFNSLGGYTYYFNGTGKMLKGFNSLGGYTYYFNGTGKMLTGFNTLQGDKYYFDTDGKMLTGKQVIGGKEYYFDKDGKLLEGKNGFVVEGNYTYYYINGVKQIGFQDIDSYTYYFNGSGIMLKGFNSLGGYTYYFNGSGKMLKGFNSLGGYTYYFNGTGKMLTGFNTLQGDKYYFDADGKMLTGKQVIDGKEYYFDEDGKLVEGKNGFVVEGNYTYYYKNGVKQTGFQDIDSYTYYFNGNGIMLKGFNSLGGYTYYFNGSGKMLKGFNSLGGYTYYFNSTGKMLTGLCSLGGDTYFFDSSGKMQTDWTKADGKWYYFKKDGTLDSNPSENSPANPQYKIEGGSSVTVQNMVTFFKNKKAVYPSYYGKSDAPTLDKFCQIYYEEANAEGIKAEVAFVQAMLETGWLKFGGAVDISQYNFAGIGAVDGGAQGAKFSTVREGVRAQIQHLKAYANNKPLNNAVVDPRFNLVSRGSSTYVEWLGQKENPTNAGWATSKSYGYMIIRLMKDIK